MIPSNVDPRRPDKVQRYKPTQPNGNAPGDDLTPDYMNILGPETQTATANADAPTDLTTEEQRPAQESEGAAAISVLPVSPQYGTPSAIETLSETSTPPTDTLTETTAKNPDTGDNKDLHSTPSRNDRFKVVKIASLEPFRRGRWKCMDYVDQTAPPSTTASKTQTPSIYMQTQSLPPQQFQQLLVQGGYGNPQYFQNVPSQILPQNTQYFYPAPQGLQTQTLPQQLPPNSVYISAGGQPYIQQSVVPNSVGGFTVQTYPNLQYVPANMAQNQNSAFIPTSQNVNTQILPNFQQSQTYAGQPSVSQPNITQPVVNGHVYPPNQTNEPVATSLPTQVGKIAILTTQPQTIPNQVPQSISLPNTQTTQLQNVPVQAVIPTQQYNQVPQQNAQSFAPPGQVIVNQVAPPAQSLTQVPPVTTQTVTNVYANPQFVTSVNNAPPPNQPNVSEQVNREPENADLASGEPTETNGEDPSRSNPVVNPVNAIDNKIEQAMDLVKSHLMYTVREEVEVLKEKITELMEKIQQLETENNFLRSQLPKGQNVNPNGTPDPPQ